MVEIDTVEAEVVVTAIVTAMVVVVVAAMVRALLLVLFFHKKLTICNFEGRGGGGYGGRGRSGGRGGDRGGRGGDRGGPGKWFVCYIKIIIKIQLEISFHHCISTFFSGDMGHHVVEEGLVHTNHAFAKCKRVYLN